MQFIERREGAAQDLRSPSATSPLPNPPSLCNKYINRDKGTGMTAPAIELKGISKAFGPVQASDIPEYVRAGYRKTKKMSTIEFPMLDRLVLTSQRRGASETRDEQPGQTPHGLLVGMREPRHET